MPNFTIWAEGATEANSSAKTKADALAAAETLRTKERVAVEVRNSKGNVTAQLDAPKRIKMSKPFTRTVPVPEGVTVPDGFRFAYSRPRRGVAVVHSPEQGYRLLNLGNSKLRKGSHKTSRAAGKAVLELPTKAEQEQANA